MSELGQGLPVQPDKNGVRFPPKLPFLKGLEKGLGVANCGREPNQQTAITGVSTVVTDGDLFKSPVFPP